jgi:hypothetical protein
MVRHLATKYGGQVDLLHVYVREAHPKDEWSWGGDAISCSIRQPRTLDERLAVARRFADTYQLDPNSIVVDTMTNAIEQQYKGWPERLYVLDHGKIVFVGQPGPFGYIPEEVDRFLAGYLAKRQ